MKPQLLIKIRNLPAMLTKFIRDVESKYYISQQIHTTDRKGRLCLLGAPPSPFLVHGHIPRSRDSGLDLSPRSIPQ